MKKIMKKIMLGILLASSLLFSSDFAKMTEIGANIEINDILKRNGCTVGDIAISDYEDNNVKVELTDIGGNVFEVRSTVKNWTKKDIAQMPQLEGTWTVSTTSLIFNPVEDFTRNPSKINYSITNEDCSDSEGTITSYYVSGDHFVGENLSPAPVSDSFDYVIGMSRPLNILKNDIQLNKYEEIVLAECNDQGEVVSTYEDENGTINTVTADRTGSYYDGTWTIQGDQVVFTPIVTNYESVKTFWTSYRPYIGYTLRNRETNQTSQLCGKITLLPKVITNTDIYLDDHNKTDITAKVLDYQLDIPTSHAAVVRETLLFSNGEKFMNIANEGSWSINDIYITFRPFENFDSTVKNPTPVSYRAEYNNDQELSNFAKLSLFYLIKANDDTVFVETNSDQKINVTSNDTGNILERSVELITLEEYITLTGKTLELESNEINVENTVSNDRKSLTIDGQGEYKVVENTVYYYADLNYERAPSRIGYKVRDKGTNQVDYGLIELKRYTNTVSGKVYYDVNKDGLLTKGENGIPNLSITITDINEVSYQLLTDATGGYSVEIPTGSVQISLNNANIPTYLSPNISESTTLTLIKDKAETYNIGYKKQSGTLQVFLFEDENNNNALDDGESPMSNVKLLINGKNTIQINENGVVKDVLLVTSADGSFAVELDIGNYTFNIDSSSIPEGYQFTGSIAENITVTDGSSHVITSGDFSTIPLDPTLVKSDSGSAGSISTIILTLLLTILMVRREQKKA